MRKKNIKQQIQQVRYGGEVQKYSEKVKENERTLKEVKVEYSQLIINALHLFMCFNK